MKTPRYQNGNASTEWTMVVVAIFVALFIPFDGQNSAVSIFMDAVRIFHANSSFPMSLP